MAKQIKFEYEGKEYTLEYTRRSIQQMEQQGFTIGDVEKKPMTVLPELFAGAFIAHHKFAKRDVIDGIYANMTDKQDLLNKLSEMYADPIMALMEEPEEDEEKNVKWEANF